MLLVEVTNVSRRMIFVSSCAAEVGTTKVSLRGLAVLAIEFSKTPWCPPTKVSRRESLAACRNG